MADYAGERATAWGNSALDARLMQDDDGFREALEAQVTALTEATYHAASAGDFDAAAAILHTRLYFGPQAQLTTVLGRYEVALDLLRQLFPLRDVTLDPRTADPQARRWVLHETAACLHALGDLEQATVLALRAAAAAMTMDDPHNAAISYHNLAETYLASGALDSCRISADSALRLSEQSGDREDALVAHTLAGYVADLTDELAGAGRSYEAALRIAVEETSVPMLYSLSGYRYALHLHFAGNPGEAFRVSLANLSFCRGQGWTSDVALVLSQLTIIPSDAAPDELRSWSEESVDLARSAGSKHVLAEVLLAQAQHANARGAPAAALVAAGETMTIAQSYGLRRTEVDARTQLASAYAAQGHATNARAEAHLARDLAGALGYRRGHRVAEALLRAFGAGGQPPSA
jgi:tetratricopeptide (TPR) repeat protein